MLGTVETALDRVASPFSRAILGQTCRRETGDGGIVMCENGSVFKLESVLGVGGLSTVYKAVRFSDGKQVALKLADCNKAPESADLLAREMSILRRLHHKHIVSLVECGLTTEGDPYLAMDLIRGQSLEQMLLAHSVLPVERAANICLQVAHALEHAHERGVIHRDIKPANIMVTNIDGDDFVYIVDFGIAMLMDESGESSEESDSGSLLYASPEQLAAASCSGATDIYQLALVMFEALTGRLPFEISLKGALEYRSQGPLLVDNTELGDQALSLSIRRVLEKALARSVETRTASMGQFADQLRAALNQIRVLNQPITLQMQLN